MLTPRLLQNEEISNHIRLGKEVEGRDEKGIKKTVAAFMKILHPHGELDGSVIGPTEQHFTIHYGDTGYTYELIIGPYLAGATSVTIEEPYIRARHQIANFVRFCETVLKAPTVRTIKLVAGYDD